MKINRENLDSNSALILWTTEVVNLIGPDYDGYDRIPFKWNAESLNQAVVSFENDETPEEFISFCEKNEINLGR